jgi:hypothetical protein
MACNKNRYAPINKNNKTKLNLGLKNTIMMVVPQKLYFK